MLRHCVGAVWLAAACLMYSISVSAQGTDAQRFKLAWEAASQGKRAQFNTLKTGLSAYHLYPYLQYEDYRHRRARVGVKEMAGFLDRHRDWAFHSALHKAWLVELGKQKRWKTLLRHGRDSKATVVRCYLASARINSGEVAGLDSEVRDLWLVGRSQPKACDAPFQWFERRGGINPTLAWARIRAAIKQGNASLALYLKRYLPRAERVWAERWVKLRQQPQSTFKQALTWTNNDKSREMVAAALKRLARSDNDRAWHWYTRLQKHFSWSAQQQGAVLHQLALYAAVGLAPDALDKLQRVPASHRDAQLLQWQIRAALAKADWGAVLRTIVMLPDELREDERWQYWRARALQELGDHAAAQATLQELAGQTNYYGFLAADRIAQPYTICPQTPKVSDAAVRELRRQPRIARALALRRADINNWARAEWRNAARGLSKQQLRAAAALAIHEDWAEQAIFALGNSGDRRWYEWRFPTAYQTEVAPKAKQHDLDFAWIYATMRSESAMAVDAISSANARGLLQVTPGTAKQLARRYPYLRYRGQQQLLQARENIAFGTVFMRELLDRFADNPVLVAGAYNAGPHVVDRWLDKRPKADMDVWIETLPYYETRDYIPRVLTFASIYDWRLGRPVHRVSARMPAWDGAIPVSDPVTAVACSAAG